MVDRYATSLMGVCRGAAGTMDPGKEHERIRLSVVERRGPRVSGKLIGVSFRWLVPL